MIKIALKHLFLEGCINVLFSNIQKNFIQNSRFKIGDKIPYIRIFYWDDDITYVSILHSAKILSYKDGVYRAKCIRLFLGEENPSVTGPDYNGSMHWCYDGKYYDYTRILDPEPFEFSDNDVIEVIK